MKNIKMIFEKNPQTINKICIDKGTAIFENTENIFSGLTIKRIITFINSIHQKYKKIKMPIIFSLGTVLLADKLSYIIFECICYSLIKDYKHKVTIYWNPKDDIYTTGVNSTAIKYLCYGNEYNIDKFLQMFKMEIHSNYYRRVINGYEREDTNYLGNLLQEIDSFLKYFSIEEEYRDQVSEVITELVGNACEHGKADCLLDIDITPNYIKTVKDVEQQGNFYGINIAILNFSDILLCDGIKEKIDSGNLGTERYTQLERAYNYHKNNFSDEYTYTDFCNISALQDKISGRPHHSLVGGTGLTKLIRSLQEKSDNDTCYVLSGRRTVMLIKDTLKYDNDNWLGFNKESNFFDALPEKGIIDTCPIFFTGTAYNLNFIMKREEVTNNEN